MYVKTELPAKALSGREGVCFSTGVGNEGSSGQLVGPGLGLKKEGEIFRFCVQVLLLPIVVHPPPPLRLFCLL